MVKRSGLRGRGGAGFPAGTKWSFVPKSTDSPLSVRERRRASRVPSRTG